MSAAADQLPVERKPMGRPSEYTPEIAAALVEATSEGLSVQKAAKRCGIAPVTVYQWVRLHPDFAKLYAQARKDAAYVLAEETIDIADDSSRDFELDEETGKYIFNGEHVQRARLRWDARRWLASKYLPKVFGDKVEVEHSGSIATGQLDAQGVIDGLVSLANEQPIAALPLITLLEDALTRLRSNPAIRPALEHQP